MDQLLILNQRGIFPGPNEAEADFYRRAASFSQSSTPAPMTKNLFDAAPDWLKVEYGAKGLMPWEGAATWIGDGRASIQVKQSLLTRMYPQDEVIAHEMVHGMRLMLNAERFEEILAYRVSKSRFRRFFGPLFSSPAESKGFVLALAASWAIYLAEIFFDLDLGGNFFFLAPVAFLGWGLFRLARSQKVFAHALRRLELATPGQSLAVALRLTDREIELFSKSSPEEIRAFAHAQQTLRWKQIALAYF